ncbi:MAG: hypothetical protein R3D28_23385 [Geminicoccaceae bacterium]
MTRPTPARRAAFEEVPAADDVAVDHLPFGLVRLTAEVDDPVDPVTGGGERIRIAEVGGHEPLVRRQPLGRPAVAQHHLVIEPDKKWPQHRRHAPGRSGHQHPHLSAPCCVVRE